MIASFIQITSFKFPVKMGGGFNTIAFSLLRTRTRIEKIILQIPLDFWGLWRLLSIYSSASVFDSAVKINSSRNGVGYGIGVAKPVYSYVTKAKAMRNYRCY